MYFLNPIKIAIHVKIQFIKSNKHHSSNASHSIVIYVSNYLFIYFSKKIKGGQHFILATHSLSHLKTVSYYMVSIKALNRQNRMLDNRFNLNFKIKSKLFPDFYAFLIYRLQWIHILSISIY